MTKGSGASSDEDRAGHERSQSSLSPPVGDHPLRCEFTPGPWCAGTDEYGDVVVDPVGSEERVCTVGHNAQGTRPAIASFGHFDTQDVRADANLIAAAPDLYAALAALFEAGRIHDPDDWTGEGAMCAAQDALRKARGEHND